MCVKSNSNVEICFVTFYGGVMKVRTIMAVSVAVVAISAIITAQRYKKISAEEVQYLLDSKENVIVVDVRSKEEYDKGHIPGAILLPNSQIQETCPPQLPNLTDKIIVYCGSGRLSAMAAKKLSNLGYKKVLDMGGLQSWKYEIEK